MNKILTLWATPRSTSTAFSRMMGERRDFLVIDQPFGLYYHYSEERKSNRYSEVEANPKYNFQLLLQGLVNKAQSQSVFIKDMARFIDDRADKEFLSYFHHTFIIRHPAKALPSLFARWSDFSLSEAGYAELYQLFETTKAFMGKVPVVINSDDLVYKPESTVKAYCDAVGIPFMSQALNWNGTVTSEINQWEGGWHTYTQSSQGFKERERKNYVRIEDNKHLKEAYKYCFPYYQKLCQYQLKIE